AIQSKQHITYEVWFKLLINFFTTHHLPFNILNIPSIPSPRTLSRRLRDESLNQQITALSTLPEGSKLLIALDCWTSPYS
ncbi:uncharacterized protein N7503_001216, partial [Penicillium pulvis]|uniref:uncharacterized protein n=1 Tax=Penicillium pulvis TaxID=1562058 RepID=UPI002548AAB3